ncbi:hypothetical protein FBQ96_11490 [Nitrospirales bacterium NOB]|nr:hypothetical protein [Nitrospira sp.]MDL1890184.1 hypothetical protein [Nitrospirales bacterium NOB]RIK56144.1 MAG: hypothetical protein DCC63_18080 [Nitrospira sp.]
MNYVALRMLFGDRAKYLMLLCGLTFSVMLIVQQGSIREAAIPPAQAQMEEQNYRIGDLETQLKRLRAVQDSRAISDDDVKRT